MKNIILTVLLAFGLILLFSNCNKSSYSLGDLTPPKDVTITAEIVGQDTDNPNGDGSGVVNITVSSDYALSYMIQYDETASPVYSANGTLTHKYTTLGLNTYTITATVYGRGGTSATATTQVTVQSNFEPDAAIVTDLTNDDSKTWVVNKDIAGHFGVGPWDVSSVTPSWWSAGVDEKVSCCNCFYTATYTFTKNSDGTYTLTVATPDGAFTKTGSLTTLPGIPSSGDEACYPYAGGTGSFSFIPAGSGVDASASTQTSILLSGTDTFIGYGATLKEYEILSISDVEVYLRVQGTETGNAWYIKLKPKS
ncbi:hypothetical protein [Parafilimonas sp.]|uniref:hypothetical protein n=1 Tax=Parafilimonas sp. TaxID=1969739 RepID=UPI0039E2F6A3